MAFDRVVIYPTDDMKKWILDRNEVLKEETRAKLYVAITRARHSVAFVMDERQKETSGRGQELLFEVR